MQKYNSIKLITDNNLCISCGACTHICPFDNIDMKYSSFRGKWDAIVENTEICLKCNGETNCLYVCPSHNMDYTKFGSQENEFLGKIENIYNGWSKSENRRFHSSSGGFIRELCKSLLDKKLITSIISITHDEGLEYTPKNITDIGFMPNSIYHNINYENAFKIIKNCDGKFLIIGLPCQLTGIELLLSKKKYAYLKDRIYLKVALICGYTFDRVSLDFFAALNSFDMEEISYREEGRYRKTRISNEDNSLVFDVNNPKTINEKINNMMMFDKWMPQKHCLFCVDHLGYCADVVIGDAWQNRYNNDFIGTNIIIARTILGNNIVKGIENIILEDGNMSEIEESQNIYAKPFLGLSIAKENVFKDDFITNHIVSGDSYKKRYINFSIKEKLKIVFLKELLRRKYFKFVKIIYILLEVKLVIKLFIKKILRIKI